jgi:hypothetical protein
MLIDGASGVAISGGDLAIVFADIGLIRWAGASAMAGSGMTPEMS